VGDDIHIGQQMRKFIFIQESPDPTFVFERVSADRFALRVFLKGRIFRAERGDE